MTAGALTAMLWEVAALYVDPRGPYPGLVREWFDASRDATNYKGPWPVVAHPPCGPWGTMRHLSSGQGEAQDATCGPVAVSFVRQFGGVLEHPRGSTLFRHCAMPHPGELPDDWGGVTFEVQQCDWGHPARKRTWLYVVGASLADFPSRPPPREPTHWASGSRNAPRGPVPPGIKVCSAQQRRRTPVAFAHWLIDLALRCTTQAIPERSGKGE